MIATIIILVLMFAGLLLEANRHGKEKTGKYDFWTHLIATAIFLILYYFAGLFNNFKS